MTAHGLLTRLESAPGKELELEGLLAAAHAAAEAEPGTTSWSALRFGQGEYGTFVAFPDDAARQRHLDGDVVAPWRRHPSVLDGEPEVEAVDVLADKLTTGAVTKGLLLRLPIGDAHLGDAEEFLHGGRSVVEEEPATTAWFALRFANGEYGVFDVFPDSRGRRAHLTGKIPQRLAVHGLPWLRGLPSMAFADVLAHSVRAS